MTKWRDKNETRGSGSGGLMLAVLLVALVLYAVYGR